MTRSDAKRSTRAFIRGTPGCGRPAQSTRGPARKAAALWTPPGRPPCHAGQRWTRSPPSSSSPASLSPSSSATRSRRRGGPRERKPTPPPSIGYETLDRLARVQGELRLEAQRGREDALVGLAGAAQDLQGRLAQAQRALAEVKALEQARGSQLDRATDSLRRLELVVAGSGSRGAAGENVLARALAQLPPGPPREKRRRSAAGSSSTRCGSPAGASSRSTASGRRASPRGWSDDDDGRLATTGAACWREGSRGRCACARGRWRSTSTPSAR